MSKKKKINKEKNKLVKSINNNIRSSVRKLNPILRSIVGKKVEVAIASGDATAAREALRAAQPELQRGVSRGVLHKNTASRKISRLAARVKALAA